MPRRTLTDAERKAIGERTRQMWARRRAAKAQAAHDRAIRAVENNSTHEIRIAVTKKNAAKLLALLMRLPLVEAITIVRPTDTKTR